jgi:hypothetical protein
MPPYLLIRNEKSKAREMREKVGPIPEMGRGVVYAIHSSVARRVNLCGKEVVKLGEKKAYDHSPQGRWRKWPIASNFYER